MKLTEEQAQQVINYITRLSGGRDIVCPICGGIHWSVNNVVTEMREFQNGDLVLGKDSAIMPFVSIMCRNCAHTLFINAIIAGIVNPKRQESSEESNSGEGK